MTAEHTALILGIEDQCIRKKNYKSSDAYSSLKFKVAKYLVGIQLTYFKD